MTQSAILSACSSSKIAPVDCNSFSKASTATLTSPSRAGVIAFKIAPSLSVLLISSLIIYCNPVYSTGSTPTFSISLLNTDSLSVTIDQSSDIK
jgi:hypothetical protein